MFDNLFVCAGRSCRSGYVMGYAGGDGDVCAVCCAAMQLMSSMCAGGMGEVLLDESEGEGVSAWCGTTTYVRCAEGR
jgi:hypothetical protein